MLNITLDIEPKRLNSDTISYHSLQYMRNKFDKWCTDIKDGIERNFLDHIFIITYIGNTLDPIKLMDDFREKNKNLIYDMSYGECGFHKFLPYQHSGIFFVDCKGSRDGYIQNMTGLHIHAAVVVHPHWRDRFTGAFGGLKIERLQNTKLEPYVGLIGRITNNELMIMKVNPTEDDVLMVISYCAKAVIHKNGFYHERENFYGMIGNIEKSEFPLVAVRNSKKVIHHVNPSSLTTSMSNIGRLGCASSK